MYIYSFYFIFISNKPPNTIGNTIFKIVLPGLSNCISRLFNCITGLFSLCFIYFYFILIVLPFVLVILSVILLDSITSTILYSINSHLSPVLISITSSLFSKFKHKSLTIGYIHTNIYTHLLDF